MEKLNVAVLMGGCSSEREVSIASGENVVNSLDTGKYTAVPVEIAEDGAWLTRDASSKGQSPVLLQPGNFEVAGRKVDVVFIALHGKLGEDGAAQGLLEMIGVPYTGSGVLASALAMNKLLTKKIFLQEEIPTAPFVEINNPDWPEDVGQKTEIAGNLGERLGLPVVVKPASEGSSIGVDIARTDEEMVRKVDEAFAYGPVVLAEKYLKAREIQCGIIGNGCPYALPLIEIVSKKEFFDYEAKYSPELAEEIVPAPIPEKETKKIQNISLRAYKAVGCRGFARVDTFLQKEGEIFVSEINTIPGLTRASLFPQEAEAAGIDFPQLLSILIELALEEK